MRHWTALKPWDTSGPTFATRTKLNQILGDQSDVGSSHKPFATYLSTAYFKRMFSEKKTSTDFKSDFGPTYPIMCSTSMLSWQDFKVEYYIWWHIIQCSKTPKFCYSNIRIPLPSPSLRKKSYKMGPPKIAKLPHKWLNYGLSVDITN